MASNGENTVYQIFHEFKDIDFLLITLIIAGAFLSIYLLQRVILAIAERVPGRFRLTLPPFIPIFRLIILMSAFFSIVPLVIKPTVQNFIAIFGAVGLTLGFAFKDYISSLIAGIVAVWEQPYRPGDWVTVDEVYGEVKSLGLRALTVLTPDDTLVTIPHSKIWNSNIYNANSGKQTHLCVSDFFLHPQHNAQAVRRSLLDVALTSPYLQLNRPVTVIVSEEPWGTHYRIKAYPVDGRNEFQFISDLTVRGKAALAVLGVSPVMAPAIPLKEPN